MIFCEKASAFQQSFRRSRIGKFISVLQNNPSAHAVRHFNMQTDLCVCALPAYKDASLRHLMPPLGKRHAIWKERLDAVSFGFCVGKQRMPASACINQLADIAPEMMVERGHLIALRLEFLPERCCAARDPVAIRRKIRSCDHMQRQCCSAHTQKAHGTALSRQARRHSCVLRQSQ